METEPGYNRCVGNHLNGDVCFIFFNGRSNPMLNIKRVCKEGKFE